MITEKECTRCHETKSTELFHKRKDAKCGLKSWCIECVKETNKLKYATDEGRKTKRKYVERNKEHIKKIHREYQQTNKKELHQKRRKLYVENIERELETKMKRRVEHIERYIFQRAKTRAKAKNREFTIEESDVYVPECCPVFGFPLDRTGKDLWKCPSLDRIDNNKGYIKGNVIVISHRANTLKTNATPEELQTLVDFLKSLAQNKIELLEPEYYI